MYGIFFYCVCLVHTGVLLPPPNSYIGETNSNILHLSTALSAVYQLSAKYKSKKQTMSPITLHNYLFTIMEWIPLGLQSSFDNIKRSY